MRGLVLVAMITAWAIPDALAGPRRLAWTSDTDVVPERGVELEQWTWESIYDGGSDGYLTWAVVAGITDQLELVLPLAWQWDENGFEVQSYGAEVRWRLVSSDPVEAPPVVPLLRLAARRIATGDQRDHVLLGAGIILSTDVIRRLHLVLDASVDVIPRDSPLVESNYVLGGSYAVTDELSLGATAWLYLVHDAPAGYGRGWLAAGPELSWSHGRFWLSTGLLFGVTSGSFAAPTYLPRINWGVFL